MAARSNRPGAFSTSRRRKPSACASDSQPSSRAVSRLRAGRGERDAEAFDAEIRRRRRTGDD
jgi:hypothetical protein